VPPAARTSRGADLARQLIDEPVHELRRRARDRVARGREHLGARLAGLGGIDHAAPGEQIEHAIAPRQHRAEVNERIVRGRRARDHREQRGLAGRQRARRLAEVQARRGVEPVRAVAEVRAVEPLLEDRALVDRAFEAQREDGLPQLVRNRSLVLRAEQHARDLHRERRAAEAAAARVEPRGAHDADRIDAAVIPEAFIFRLDHARHRDRR
jgi:hypothetical protein